MEIEHAEGPVVARGPSAGRMVKDTKERDAKLAAEEAAAAKPELPPEDLVSPCFSLHLGLP